MKFVIGIEVPEVDLVTELMLKRNDDKQRSKRSDKRPRHDKRDSSKSKLPLVKCNIYTPLNTARINNLMEI